jgi:hypothetical protein
MVWLLAHIQPVGKWFEDHPRSTFVAGVLLISGLMSVTTVAVYLRYFIVVSRSIALNNRSQEKAIKDFNKNDPDFAGIADIKEREIVVEGIKRFGDAKVLRPYSCSDLDE